ncbi:hypothetical protein CI610_01435 [invertebrate metagenome]|uniref:Transporter n=1 Tax=invertebrate metagenome TaxID=1711999 RepID=A0A2H9T8Y1_9ZZZZ
MGLGSIWRFPYIAGENGGGLFFFLFIVFVVLMGLPVMVSEIAVGRAGRVNPVDSLERLSLAAGGSRHWRYVAWCGAITAIMVLSFYSVVAGWALHYLILSLTGSVTGSSIVAASEQMNNFLLSPVLVIVFHTFFMLLTIWVNSRQVSQGIGKLNAWLMPLMYGLLLFLMMWAATLPGFIKAIDYLFMPRFDSLSWRVILEAMGHAFFTLAVGACCLMAYGAYMPSKQPMIKSVILVAVMDVLVAMMAGVVIFSLLFSEDLDPSAGPGLMFVTLPVVLSAMPLGSLFLPLFFSLLVMATWTSSVNLLESMVVMLSERFALTRKFATWLSGAIVWALGIIPALSFNVFRNLEPIPGWTIFDVYTAIATQVLLPLTGLLILFFAGYVMDKEVLLRQLGQNRISSLLWRGIIRYVSPVLVLIILIFGLI